MTAQNRAKWRRLALKVVLRNIQLLQRHLKDGVNLLWWSEIWESVTERKGDQHRRPYPVIACVTPFGWNNGSETLLVAAVWHRSPPLLNEMIWVWLVHFRTFVSLQSVIGWFTGMFGVIVVLHGPWPTALNFWLVSLWYSRITHGGFCHGEMQRCNPAKQPHDTSTSFFSWFLVLSVFQTCPLFSCPHHFNLDLSVRRTLY